MGWKAGSDDPFSPRLVVAERPDERPDAPRLLTQLGAGWTLALVVLAVAAVVLAAQFVH
jgi:hypothetical protein